MIRPCHGRDGGSIPPTRTTQILWIEYTFVDQYLVRNLTVTYKKNAPLVYNECVLLVGLCALGGIRTPNNGSEDRRDIHFTTRASCCL